MKHPIYLTSCAAAAITLTVANARGISLWRTITPQSWHNSSAQASKPGSSGRSFASSRWNPGGARWGGSSGGGGGFSHK